MIRVEEPEQIASDKVTVIACSASLLAQPIFQWRHGTDPVAELHEGVAKNYEYVKSNDRPRFVHEHVAE